MKIIYFKYETKHNPTSGNIYSKKYVNNIDKLALRNTSNLYSRVGVIKPDIIALKSE